MPAIRLAKRDNRRVNAHFILYVADQARAARFYSSVLAKQPRLDVPGMTEFELTNGAILGLMPEAGIRRLLGDALPDPAGARGTPRAELYLVVDDPARFLDRALAAGATPLSPLIPRDWGHVAGYCLDPDAHVLAFAMADQASPHAGQADD
ncbi:MAG: VOC family protein [Thermoanaerobaculia bacterium]